MPCPDMQCKIIHEGWWPTRVSIIVRHKKANSTFNVPFLSINFSFQCFSRLQITLSRFPGADLQGLIAWVMAMLGFPVKSLKRTRPIIEYLSHLFFFFFLRGVFGPAYAHHDYSPRSTGHPASPGAGKAPRGWQACT